VGSSAAAGRAVWLIGEGSRNGAPRDLKIMNLTPPILVGLTFVLGLLFTRGKNGAQA
jgi:hypothetical protein